MSPWLIPTISVTVSGIAAITDLRTGRIPNLLTFPAILLGLVLNGVALGFVGLVGSVLGLAICAVAPGIVYKASNGRGIGGGDLKLFAALGALLGPTQGLEAELSSFVLLCVFALLHLAFRGQLLRTLVGSLRVFGGLVVPRLRDKTAAHTPLMCEMRMGPAIFAGVGSVLLVPLVTRCFPWLL